MRRSFLVKAALGATCLAVLSQAIPATAALCAKWDPPPKGVTGVPASITFRTYIPIPSTGDAYTLEPHAFPDYPFRVRASSPDGAVSEIDMSPDPDAGQVWMGSLTPDRQGRWTLTITNLQDSDAACYTDAVLTVDQASSDVPTYAAIGLVAILVGLAGLTLVRRRVRSRSASSRS